MNNKEKKQFIKDNTIIQLQELKEKLGTDIEILSETNDDNELAKIVNDLQNYINYTNGKVIHLLSRLPEVDNE
jgi:PHP family Zn ribbon phosphoesterase